VGVAQGFLRLANPSLAAVITDAIGDGWITDLTQLEKLKPLADDRSFCTAVRRAKRGAKTQFLRWLDLPGIDPDSIPTAFSIRKSSAFTNTSGNF
jgi:starch phosphorylase